MHQYATSEPSVQEKPKILLEIGEFHPLKRAAVPAYIINGKLVRPK